MNWGKCFGYVEVDENMLNVIQRIEILQISLDYFLMLDFKSLDNLTELNLTIQILILEVYFKISGITFNNLIKLTFDRVLAYDMNIISQLKFPKLEYFDCSTFKFYIGEWYTCNLPIYSRFFNHIKNIKTLKWGFLIQPNLLN